MEHEGSWTYEHGHSEQCTTLVDFQAKKTTEYLCVLNISTKTIQRLEKIDNYSGYTKVLGNGVQSSMKIMRNHVISNGVTEHEKKPDR